MLPQDMVLPMPPNCHHHHNSVLVLAVVLVRLDDTNHGLIDHSYATLHQLSDSPIQGPSSIESKTIDVHLS